MKTNAAGFLSPLKLKSTFVGEDWLMKPENYFGGRL